MEQSQRTSLADRISMTEALEDYSIDVNEQEIASICEIKNVGEYILWLRNVFDMDNL